MHYLHIQYAITYRSAFGTVRIAMIRCCNKYLFHYVKCSALLSGSSEIIDKYAKDGKMLCALAKNQAEEALKALLPDNKGIDNRL